MALKAGYIGVKRRIYEKLQAITTKNVQDIADIWTDNTKTGVHNFLLPLTGSYDNNGITITPENNNVGIKINGTSTAEINYDYIPEGSILANLRGKFKLSLGVDSIAGMNVVFYKSTSGSWNLSGAVKEIEVNLTDAEHLNGKVRIYIANAKTYADVVINPMITALEDPDTTPTPFAMTNRQLTKAYEIVNKTGVTFDDTYCDVSGCSYSLSVKGNLAQIIGVVKITTQVPQYTKFIEGLPPVKSSGGAAYNFALLSSADGTKTYRCYLDTYGKISAHVTPLPVGSYVLSFVYFCAEDTAIYTRSLDREVSPEVIEDEPAPVTKTTRSTKKSAMK